MTQPQQPGPPWGPQIEPPVLPLEEPNTENPLKTWAIFLLPHLGQVTFKPLAFSEIDAWTSVFSIHSVHTYS